MMMRGILITSGAVIGVAGSIAYPVGGWQPSALVGQSESMSFGGASSAPTGAQTIDGDTVQTKYGPVQVELKVTGTHIDSVKALQTPSGQNQRWTDHAVPILIQETISAQNASIANVSGCSYTTQGFVQSLQSALAKI